MAVQENVWVCKSKRVSIQMTVLSSASLGAVHIHLVLFGGGGKGKGKGWWMPEIIFWNWIFFY